MDTTMNSALYPKIMKENIWPSVHDLKLKHTWVQQQYNNPKHTSKSTSETVKTKLVASLDLNLIKMLLHDIEKAIHAQSPPVSSLCKEVSAKISPWKCKPPVRVNV